MAVTETIATWNVNGIRSALGDGLAEWAKKSNFDYICMQETKVADDLMSWTYLQGYHTEFVAAQRPGYSGVGISQKSGFTCRYLRPNLFSPELNKEGRIIAIETPRYFLFSVYAPHSHRDLRNLQKKFEFMKALIEFSASFGSSAKPVILAGDFNVANEEIDVANAKQNVGNANYHPEERLLFKKLLSLGFVDAFREKCNNSGHYTWWSLLPGVRDRNVGWRLDYVLVDNRLRSNIKSCYHDYEVKGSDHCPVVLELEFSD